jgi:hypothetical protein
MQTPQTTAKEVKRILAQESKLLDRLQKLAPPDYEQMAAAGNGTAMTWRSTLERMDGARECLDDLEAALRYGSLDEANTKYENKNQPSEAKC